jgi:hypothetical protein
MTMETFLPIIRAALALVALAQALARPSTDVRVDTSGPSSPSATANRTRSGHIAREGATTLVVPEAAPLPAPR